MNQHPLGLKRLFRRRFNIILGILGFCLALTFAACASNPDTASTPESVQVEPTEVAAMPAEIRIGYQVIPNAEVLAKAMGYVEEAMPETTVSWLSFDSGRDVNTAMASGGIDLGLAGSVPVSTGLAQDLPYMVYLIHDIIGDNEALGVTADSGIATMADVVGKKIAVPFGSTTHFSLLSALDKEGIDPNTVEVLDMQPPDMLAAWQRGDIDGGFVWHPTLSRMMEDGGTILVTARQLAEEGIITADLGVVQKDFASQYPDAVATYVAAMDQAVQFYRDNPEEAAEAISGEIGLSPEESLAVMNELVWLSADEQADPTYLGTPEQPGAMAQVLKDSAEFMVSQGAIASAPDLEVYQSAVFKDAVAKAAQK